MNFNNLFNRWSFILPSIFFTSSILIFILALQVFRILYQDGPYEKIGEVVTIAGYYILFQIFALFTCIIYFVKEINPNFRIKNKILLKTLNNLVFRIILTILTTISLLFMIFVTYCCLCTVFKYGLDYLLTSLNVG